MIHISKIEWMSTMPDDISERLRFFYRLSYEFRLPLNALLLSVELLERHGSDCNEEIQTESLQCIRESAQQMNQLFKEALAILSVD